MATLPEQLAAAVGAAHVLTEPDVLAGYTRDWTGRFGGPARLVVRPAATGEVAAVVRACAAEGVPVVVQGGNTGLVGGSVPGPEAPAGGPPVILSTARLSGVGPVDRVAGQLTAGAGATLAAVQAAARAAGLEFPVDLAARESATVGGMVATNAGGLHVLRYGPMRAQVVGVEAVLASGAVLSRLGGLVKDNTGYDLSHLFVGSEGTLGVVTAVRLRLVPRLPERAVALLGLESTDQAAGIVAGLRTGLDSLTAAEIFYASGLDLVRRHGGLGAPLEKEHPVYLLVEAAGRTSPVEDLIEALSALDIDEDATALGLDPSGVERLWAYRERHTEAVSSIGIPHKLDVTLPLASLGAFEGEVRAVVERAAPGSTAVLWGHVGDGNIHVNVVGPDPDDEAVDQAVLELVARYGGSISAEHGIGRAKARWLGLSRSREEIAAMQAVKTGLDPDGLFGPGVLFG